MITWIFLALLLSGNALDFHRPVEGVLSCGPQNLTMTISDKVMSSSWEDARSCSELRDRLTYAVLFTVLVGRGLRHIHDEVTVAPEQIGSTHSWHWTSHLPLECASVRVRASYKNQTRSWTLEQTFPGTRDRPQVSPKDRDFEVGSHATFCCVLPPGHQFERMSMSGYNVTDADVVNISDRMYALTVHLNRPSSHACTDVTCTSRREEARKKNGACSFVFHPPADNDLQCETRDLESVDCRWTVGRNTPLPTKQTTYHLLGRPCAKAAAETLSSQRNCSLKVDVGVGERNWTLFAQNPLGKLELTDRVDLTHRVHMFAPIRVRGSSVNARDVSLEWRWPKHRYHGLNVSCQVNVSDGDTSVLTETCGVGLTSAAVTELIPNWTYNVTARCGTAQHFWKWSDWSETFTFHTEGDVPDALDVWSQTKENHIIVMWKEPQDHQSHGAIMDYTVTWTETTETGDEDTITVSQHKHSVSLRVDTSRQYLITVTARNPSGNSPPSAIISPNVHQDSDNIKTSRIVGVNGSFFLSWTSTPEATCGYIVDWGPTSGQGTPEWLRVPPNKTETSVVSKNFKTGLRYSLSISACTPAAAVLLERREGYVSQERIPDGLFRSLRWKQRGSEVDVSWDPIPLTEQSAFIEGYVLYWTNGDDNVVFNVTTDNPQATTLTATNLRITSYTFIVKAQTAVGESGSTTFSTILNSPTDTLVISAAMSLVLVFVLVLLVSVVCCRHWTCIKNKVYPPIPKPVLTEMSLTSEGGIVFHPLPVNQCLQSEVDSMDIPHLLCEPRKPLLAPPPLIGYSNQPSKPCPPPDLIIPALSALPSSPIRGVFPNPSYNLTVEDRGPETPLVVQQSYVSSYQPQGQSRTVTPTEKNPAGQMTCDFSYVTLPEGSTR